MTQYTPTVWQDGDPITAEKLNKIENRLEEINIFPDIIVLPSIDYSGEIDYTYQEVKDYIDRGFMIPIKYKSTIDVDYYYDYIFKYDYEEGIYGCIALFRSNVLIFTAATINEKLKLNYNGGGYLPK